jgi:hypothetical protein
LTGLAIVLVCAFAASLYYVIPDSPGAKSIAFALGPSSMEPVNSSVYSLGTITNVTFQNETVWEISGYPNIATEFNSTDITGILVMPLPAYGGGLDLKEHYLLTLQYAFDWKIYTSLASEDPIGLGLLDVANYTFSHYQANYQPKNIPPIPTLNYTLQVSTTGYWDIGMPPPFYGPWTWRIDSDRIQNIISNAASPAEVNFDIDITVNLYYKITTDSGTQSGYATVTWAGRWATLQLLHDGDQLLGFRYADSDISLTMMAS